MTISVFIADDHAVVRDGLKLLLQAQPDITVAGEASNGRDAVRLIGKLAPDVAVLDIAMPQMNGIEAAAQVHAISSRTRVIILSMHASSEHVFRALQAGAAGFVLKESAGAEVVQAVRAVSAGGRFLSAPIAEMVQDPGLRITGSAGEKSPLERLSSRERQVLQLVVEGRSSADVAEVLFLSPKTVETYRSRIMQKLGVRDLTGLVKFAVQHGLTSG